MKEKNIELNEEDKKGIEELLMFQKVIKVNFNDDFGTMVLDNGVEVIITPNEGCSGCSAGHYSISRLNTCDNVITRVELKESYLDEDYEEEKKYEIFVYADNREINLLTVEGSDGNGYYGTGYTLEVKIK